MDLQAWFNINPGDTIAVIAPGSMPPDLDHIQLQESIDAFITRLGYKAYLFPNLLGPDLLCANSDSERFSQLKEAILNDAYHAIWCIRGGYGCTRLLPYLKAIIPPKKSKLLIGFSDITALHLFFQQYWRWPSLHGPTLNQAINGDLPIADIEMLQAFLLGKKPSHNLTLHPMNQAAVDAPAMIGKVIGGNLSLVQASINTFWQVEAKGKFLLLEEIQERGYRIDRMLQHLYQARIFSSVQAVLLGDFIGGLEPDQTSRVEDVLQRFADESTFPVFRIPGIGHGCENHPIPLGMSCRINPGNPSNLEIL